jgi:hypothetical protein
MALVSVSEAAHQPATWGIHNDQPDINPVSDGAVRSGWDDVGDLSLLEASREAFKQAVAERMPQMPVREQPERLTEVLLSSVR